MLATLIAAALAEPIALDLSADTGRQVVVDREQGQYLGHVSTLLLDDGKTILAVYPKGHGKGAIIYKRSNDGGLTWSERLPTPKSWETSLETPTIHRVYEPRTNKKRLLLWSGLYPARTALSEDDGQTWSELKQAGDWGGIVVMGSVERLKDGSYLSLFHDDGRFFQQGGRATGMMTLYQTLSKDGGQTWQAPLKVFAASDVHLCEPGLVRSPDQREMAILLRENKRVKKSHVMFTRSEAKAWTKPVELNKALTGDRHTLRYARDGRLVCVFRDMAEGPTKGDFVAWVGRYSDLKEGKPGQYRVRLLDNKDSWDCGYPGLEVLPNGVFVATTYGHWTKGEQPYIMSVRFTVAELDERAKLFQPPK